MEFTDNILIVAISDITNAMHDNTIDSMMDNMETVMTNGYKVSIHRKSFDDITFTDIRQLKSYINNVIKPSMRRAQDHHKTS